jgi:hypothetical protein
MPHFQAQHYKLRYQSALPFCMTFLSANSASEPEPEALEGEICTMPATAEAVPVESDINGAS